ncbi:MAG: sulfite exporter TauE/SafE family protein [Burkholderiaceae bacterium]|jgi:hypothetical protein|nr:sulfite exporter TauE/SafE family protein [Burkholderiaceae bacterium]
MRPLAISAAGLPTSKGFAMLVIGAFVAIASARMVGTPSADGAVAAVVLLAALVSSIAGFAFAALAGSALAYLRFDPVQAVMTMALCSIAIQGYSVWQLRASIRWRALAPMLAAGALTTPLGVALLVHIDAKLHAVVLGMIVTGYGTYMLLRRQPRQVKGTAWRDALAGAVGGVVGGLSSAPGLAVTIWCSMRDLDKEQQRAIYQPYILAMQFVTVTCLVLNAPLQADALRDASFVPFALLGAMVGFALYRRLTLRQFQAAVSLLLIVSGVGLLAHAY